MRVRTSLMSERLGALCQGVGEETQGFGIRQFLSRRPQFVLRLPLQARSAMLLRVHREPFANLADADSTELWAGQFGRSIGVEETPPANGRSTDRPVDLLRLESGPDPLTGAGSSTVFFRPAARRRCADDVGTGPFSSNAPRALSNSSSASRKRPSWMCGFTR